MCRVFPVDISEKGASQLSSISEESFALNDPLSVFSKSVFVEQPETKYLFALLLPVRSEPKRLGTKFHDQLLVKYFGASFCRTLSDESLLHFEYRFYVGYDFRDPVIDSKQFQSDYTAWLQSKCPVKARLSFVWIPLYGLHGRINAIWNVLSHRAHADGAHFFSPMNDDVELMTENWAYKHAMQLLSHPKYPGFGISVFRDLWMPNFPTFHVVSRVHTNIFGGAYYPLSFLGANNDPWIFTVYSVFQSAFNNSQITLRNRVGGTVNRYEYGAPEDFDGMVALHVSTVARFLRRVRLAEPWVFADDTLLAYSFACVEMVMQRFDDSILEKSCPDLESVQYRPLVFA
eukprot:ANDGO_05970.mRNA.1 hypothetical protein